MVLMVLMVLMVRVRGYVSTATLGRLNTYGELPRDAVIPVPEMISTNLGSLKMEPPQSLSRPKILLPEERSCFQIVYPARTKIRLQSSTMVLCPRKGLSDRLRQRKPWNRTSSGKGILGNVRRVYTSDIPRLK
jgi:hypothetical protein